MRLSPGMRALPCPLAASRRRPRRWAGPSRVMTPGVPDDSILCPAATPPGLPRGFAHLVACRPRAGQGGVPAGYADAGKAITSRGETWLLLEWYKILSPIFRLV